MTSLIDRIPVTEWDRVWSGTASAEIDPTSPNGLTCLNYEPLARLIPTHWTVIDFGCSYNAQAYLFENHKRLISVDLPFDPDWSFAHEIFKPSWCEFYEMSIKEWIPRYVNTLDLRETFAICGWVPNPAQVAMVRNTFSNVFAIYPSNKALHKAIGRSMNGAT